jgi:hypothetical protein
MSLEILNLCKRILQETTFIKKEVAKLRKRFDKLERRKGVINTISVATKKNLKKQITKLSDYSRDSTTLFFTVKKLKQLENRTLCMKGLEKQPRQFTTFVKYQAEHTNNICVRGRRVHIVKNGEWVPHPSAPLFWLETRESTWRSYCDQYKTEIFNRAGYCPADYNRENSWPPEMKRYEKQWRENDSISHEQIPLRKFKVDYTMSLPLNNVTLRKFMSENT